MKRICLIVVLIFSSLPGCKPAYENNSFQSWKTLTIVSEYNTRIIINNDEDTSIVNIYRTGSFFAPMPKNTKIKVDTFKACFTKAEKDTLFSLVRDLILFPAKTHGTCTEFVGYLRLSINYGQFSQEGEYNSVCNWITLSDKTKHLHDILKKRIGNVYLGEHENKF